MDSENAYFKPAHPGFTEDGFKNRKPVFLCIKATGQNSRTKAIRQLLKAGDSESFPAGVSLKNGSDIHVQ